MFLVILCWSLTLRLETTRQNYLTVSKVDKTISISTRYNSKMTLARINNLIISHTGHFIAQSVIVLLILQICFADDTHVFFSNVGLLMEYFYTVVLTFLFKVKDPSISSTTNAFSKKSIDYFGLRST